MAASWKLTLDRAVRYAVSDALAAVKSHIYDLEYSQRRSSQEVSTWNNYLVDLRTLHQQLLGLPSLEKAQWLGDEQSLYAPSFTPFVSGINDAKTNIRKVHSWLGSLPAAGTAAGTSVQQERSAGLEQEYYTRQVNHVLQQLLQLPAPGSKTWYARYQPAVEVMTPVVSAQTSFAKAVA